MSYYIKYKLSFVSDRDNDYELHILQKNYGGQPIVKKLGVAPTLSIEEGDGNIKGSSLSFSIQADVEGELRGLYTTNNKEFKVLLYRNSSLYWQGFLLPELYSEEYIDAPYDVSVTATDGLATLKAITYEREDVNVAIADIIEDILSFTQLSLPLTYHMSIAHAFKKQNAEGEVLNPAGSLPIPMLANTYISQAAYNGFTCYDVLNQILLSCNCCLMQIGGEWLVMSLTDNSEDYYSAGAHVQRKHKMLGQLGVAEVYPSGSLTLVNSPALKGANVEYSHMMRKSFFSNPDCVDRRAWTYADDSRNPYDIPGEREAFGKIFKAHCFELHPNNISKDYTLQLWQEVALNKDDSNFYELAVSYLFGTDAKLLLLSISHYGDDGITRQLTAEGWVVEWDRKDVNSYIQLTGQNKSASLDSISDIEQYEVAKVQFSLPGMGGIIKVGFINSTLNYADPLASAPIYISQVYLTVGGISGQQCTTEVEPNATQEQQGVLLAYGDTFESANAYKLETNALKRLSGENVTSWWLNGVNYQSYYDAMLQEYSRYFGTKKIQLQGAIMGEDVLHSIYVDAHSGKAMRLVTAQMDLLSDEVSVTLEEIVTANVEFTAVVYATNNTNSFGATSSGGGGAVSGGSSSVDTSHLLGREEAANTYATKSAVVELESEVADIREDFDALNDLLNDDVAGVINTWDEVVDFLNEYSESQDLASILSQMNADIANRVLYEDFEKLEEAVNPLFGYFDANGNANNALKLGGHSADYFATADALNTHITAFNNYKTATDKRLGDLEALWYMDDDGNVHTTHNIVVDGGGAFGKGSGGGGDVPSGGGIDETQLWNILGQSGTQTIHSSHIPDLSGKYLSTSGGTLRGGLTISSGNLIVQSGDTVLSKVYPIADNAYTLGQNSRRWSDVKTVLINGYTPIHSGNIGSQSVDAATRLARVGGVTDANTITFTDYSLRWYSGIANTATNLPSFSGYQNGLLALPLHSNGTTAQIYMTAGDRLYFRGNTGADWKIIAFTDSNVASATKLQTARTIWGQSFDGSGNVDGCIIINNPSGEAINITRTDGNWAYINYNVTGSIWHVGVPGSSYTGMLGSSGDFEIRSYEGSYYTGLSIRPNTSSYGKVVISSYSQSSGECSIGFRNTYDPAVVPQWVLGMKNTSNFGIWSTEVGRYIITTTPSVITSTIPMVFETPTTTNNNYNEGVRFNLGGKDNWAGFTIGGARGSVLGSNTGVYAFLVHDNVLQLRHYDDNFLEVNTERNVVIKPNLFAVISGNHECGIRFGEASTNTDFVGRYGNYMSLYNVSNAANEIKIPDNGSATIGGNTIWHAGNSNISTVNWSANKISCGLLAMNHTVTGPTLDLKHTNSSYAWNYINQESNGYTWHIGVCSTCEGSDQIEPGAYEIRGNGGSYQGIFIRQNTSSYGKLVVANNLSSETSIGFLNTKHSSTYPVWTIGTSIGDGSVSTFGWYYSNVGARAWLTSTGNFVATGGGAFGSDIRYKDITSYRQLDLETIVNAPLFTFKWTDREDKVEHLGTSAQYWLDTQFKDAVNTANKDFYHLNYGALAVGIGISVAREVKGVKTEVQLLREKVNQLEQELAQYRRA